LNPVLFGTGFLFQAVKVEVLPWNEQEENAEKADVVATKNGQLFQHFLLG